MAMIINIGVATYTVGGYAVPRALATIAPYHKRTRRQRPHHRKIEDT
jgi:hypothetical protein